MWRDKCTLIYKSGNEWCAVLRNDEFVSAPSYVKLQKAVNATRCDVEADGSEHWVTINNTHVLLNGENEVISGAKGKLNGMGYRTSTNNKEYQKGFNDNELTESPKYREGIKGKTIRSEANLKKFCDTLNSYRDEDTPEVTPEQAQEMIGALEFASTKAYYKADDPKFKKKDYEGPVPPPTDKDGNVLLANKNGELIKDSKGNPIRMVNRNASGLYLTRRGQRDTLKEAKVAGGDEDSWRKGQAQARALEDFINAAPKYKGDIHVTTTMGADQLAKLEIGGIFNNNGITTATASQYQVDKAVKTILDRKKQGDPTFKGQLPVVINVVGGSKVCASIGKVYKRTRNSDQKALLLSGRGNYRIDDISIDKNTGTVTLTVKEMSVKKLKSESEGVRQRYNGDPTRKLGTKTKMGMGSYDYDAVDKNGNPTKANSENVAFVKDRGNMSVRAFVEKAKSEGKRVVFFDKNKASLSQSDYEQRQAERDARAETFREKNKAIYGEDDE